MMTKITDFLRRLAGWPERNDDCGACSPAPTPERKAASPCCGDAATGSSNESRLRPKPGEGASYSIRVAARRDLEGVRRLLAVSSLPAEALEDQFGPQYVVAVAESTEELIGVAGFEVHGSSGLLRSVAVAPAWRGLGLGTALTKDRLEAAADRGLEDLYALTTTATDFFQDLGFCTVERREVPAEVRASTEFSEVCPSTADVLRFDLRARRR